MERRPWHKRGYSIADKSCIVGGYCEIAGKPYIVSDAGAIIEVLPDRVECELGIKDMDCFPLYENDYILVVITNDFSFRVNAQTQRLEKHRKVPNIA